MKRVFGMLIFLVGCGGGTEEIAGPNCGEVGVPAMTLITVDALTRMTITDHAVVIARDGTYADTADAVGQPPVYAMAYNRPGTYSVTVDMPGYQPWSIDNIVAVAGRCNVNRVPLAASLVKR